MKPLRTFTRGLSAAFLALTVLWSASSQAFEIAAKQGFMLDLQSGDVLLSKNAAEPLFPASMSKIMTIYLLFEQLAEGSLSEESRFLVSEKAWRKGGSKMFVKMGDEVSVSDLLQGIIVQSGNDASIVLAEGIAGSEEGFAEMMNEKAIELGMSRSNFKNSTGWPDPEHFSTAEDLAILSRAIITDFPNLYPHFSQRQFVYNNIKQSNRHPLLGRAEGVDGIKTGYTKESGFSIAISAKRNERRIILILGGMESSKQRAEESIRILNWGFNNFKNYRLFSGGEVVVPRQKVWLGGNEIPLVARKDLIASLSHRQKRNLKVEAVYLSPLLAPLAAGDDGGELILSLDSEPIKSFELVVGDNSPRVGPFSRLGQILSRWIFGE